MLLILTKSVNRCFEKNPKFDMTPLLGGTDVVFSSLIHSFSRYVSLFPSTCWNGFVAKQKYMHFFVGKKVYLTVNRDVYECIFIFLFCSPAKRGGDS